jgi:hypothetical protein
LLLWVKDLVALLLLPALLLLLPQLHLQPWLQPPVALLLLCLCHLLLLLHLLHLLLPLLPLPAGSDDLPEGTAESLLHLTKQQQLKDLTCAECCCFCCC